MDDLIRRSDAIKAINPNFWTGLAKKIEAIPSVEPKRGEWIRDASSPIAYRCTACNTLQHWSAIQDGRYHYCPNCGATMREREGE